ncbi:MAG: outer membrane lipoprotein carrier protein LolA [Alphaproteobacteria bacterium]|nr:outer membrane lipoprotein carrier protein LolA [Alphaproteobacteria bacterium]MBQ8678010.1 outer membrane lipoprotein carrier protein LolA [Alphaproteobacteria bacterium]
MRIFAFLTAALFYTFPVLALEKDAQKVQQVEDYLNNVRTLKASFVQTASNGSTAEGKLFVEKPNKIRMEYNAPTNVLIVGNGDYIIYNDKDLDQVTNIDYDDIPASLILANNIRIDGKQIKVSNYYEDDGSVVITLRYPSKPEIAPITMTFTKKPFALRQWSIVDPQSVEVIVSLYDVESDTVLDEGLFKFKKAKSPKKYKGKK